MATNRLGRLPTIVLALVVPLVALVTVLITLNVTSDSTVAASSGGGGGTSKSGSGTAIDIKNFMYSPNPITVKAGAAITVTNSDGTTHTLTADDKSFDTGDLSGGAKKTITIDKPGKYTYHCTIHNYMTGTIVAK